ncbi:fumarylacetoacetate hydrolase family protein [Metabacillus flavus]|uniref:fumarylacetoacetate hydrolase family protein n=1 Tax=Metabacillus flavus TaxID=2823519 RepID=UPI002015FB9D|nr:fumarylacetoacetate hydrolase family protein [Metabacillus flavus]
MKTALLKMAGTSGLKLVQVRGEEFVYKEKTYQTNDLILETPISGTVYGTVLNYKGELELLGDAVHEPPYKKTPAAPVLYIKPANTISGHGMLIPLPEGVEELQAGAALGIVIGKKAVRIKEEEALEYVAGYTVVNDVSIPYSSVYRPPIMQKCRDGFCPAGPWIAAREDVENPDALSIRVFVNEVLQQETTTANLIRPVSKLIADVTEFMTLEEGDILLAGVSENPPRLKDGDTVKISIESVGSLQNRVAKEEEWMVQL